MEIAKKETGLPLVTEVLSQRDVERVERSADILQVGARNVQNFALLKELGQTKKPVLLKRGMSTTIKEWLMSAEYILAEGNADVILCERGIRTFETATRNTLDLSAVPVLRDQTHLPVINISKSNSPASSSPKKRKASSLSANGTSRIDGALKAWPPARSTSLRIGSAIRLSSESTLSPWKLAGDSAAIYSSLPSSSISGFSFSIIPANISKVSD